MTKLFLIFIILIVGFANSINAQTFYVSTTDSPSIVYQLSTADCSIQKKIPNCANHILADIAIDSGQNIYLEDLPATATEPAYIYGIKPYDTTFCENLGYLIGAASSLTCDSSGIIWGVGNYVEEFNPKTGIAFLNGNWIIPAESWGDMFTYKGNFYYVGVDTNLYKINKDIYNLNGDSGLVTFYMKLPNVTGIIYGAFSINYPTETKVYLLENGSTTSSLVELDMQNKTIGPTICTYPFLVGGAAGFNCDSCSSKTHQTSCPVSVAVINQNVTICQGSSFQLKSGKVVSTAGIYNDTTKSFSGCDSMVSKINLSISPVFNKNQTITICSGSQYQLPSGKYVNMPGIYYDTTKSFAGCDSIVTKIDLANYPVFYNSQNILICPSSSFQLPTGSYTSNPGVYFDTTKNSFGCDSLITKTDLSVYPVSSFDITDSFFLGQKYTLPSGKVVNTPGNYQYILKDINGCDSIIHINLSAKSTAGCVRPVKAFTPNGDGINDVWKIFTEGCVKRTEVSVYNRWGSRVYYSANYHNDWDGNYKNNRLPDGTYYYLMNVTFYDDQTVELTGNVTIIR